MKTADLRIVRTDSTKEWDLSREHWRMYIDKIYTFYLVDVNQSTNCCELTPSYWYEFLYHEAEMKKFFYSNIPYDNQEIIMESVDDVLRTNLEEGCYVHVKRKLPGVPYGVFEYDEEEEGAYEEVIDRARENICGNPVSDYKEGL